MGRRHQLRGTAIESQKLSEKDRRALKIVSKNHRTAAAKVAAEQK
jgi:DNA-binding Lrp family transcriptional regulator